jgi:predicted NBD/HSP70 family sugar kinase
MLTFPPQPVSPKELARRRVLDALRRRGPLARVEIGQELGLSPATISEITSSLVAEGVLVVDEAGEPAGLRGRPKQRLTFADDLGAVIGVWVGYNRLEFRLVDSAGQTRATVGVDKPLKDLAPAAFLDELAGAITDFARQAADGPPIKAVGVAAQGYVDASAGVITWSPVFTAREIPVSAGLAQRLDLPVAVENDASAMALAVARRHAELQAGRTACLMIGDGVGMGFLVHGELYRGARTGGSEFGHVRIRRGGPQCRCGGRGCIEAFLADYALYRDAQLMDQRPAPASLMPSEASMRRLLDQAQGGDRALLDLLHGAGEVLGDAVGILIQTLEPDHIVICGPGTRAWPLIKSAFDDALARASIPELRLLTDVRVVESSHDLLTEGVIFQCLRELDAGLSRVEGGEARPTLAAR